MYLGGLDSYLDAGGGIRSKMRHTFTRQELYDEVWSEPKKTLAGRSSLSDVGLAKACKRANIPRPPRGHWAELKAGKKVSREALSARGPGMSDEVVVGGAYSHYYRQCSEEEILSADPQPPVFEDDMEDVAARVKAMIGHISVPRFPERAHRHIRRLLDADEERRQKQLNSRYSSSSYAPFFDDSFEKRRFRVLNAIITTLERNGMKPSVRGRHGRDLSVNINDTNVGFTLDSTTQKNDPYRDASIETRGPSTRLRLQVISWRSSSESQPSWEDTDRTKLEKHLDEIVVALIVSGERQYREGRQRRYEWLVERKAELILEIQERKEEAERHERERRIQLEQGRIDRLLGDAASLRQADEIRAYVEGVRDRCAEAGGPIVIDELGGWARWALAQADRIDPVRSGRFMESMEDPESREMAVTQGLEPPVAE